jgi:hypothetical protein
MRVFANDDTGYLDWLDRHRDGWVLNVRATPDQNYVVLHRATCHTISRTYVRQGAWTCRGYRKIGCLDLDEVAVACRTQGRADRRPSKTCGLCNRR